MTRAVLGFILGGPLLALVVWAFRNRARWERRRRERTILHSSDRGDTGRYPPSDDARAGRELAEYDWLITPDGNVLHHATLTEHQYEDLVNLGGVYEPVTLTCRRAASGVSIPGLGSRMGLSRCIRCCDTTSMPHGTGSPKNDAECRALLGLPAGGGAP